MKCSHERWATETWRNDSAHEQARDGKGYNFDEQDAEEVLHFTHNQGTQIGATVK